MQGIQNFLQLLSDNWTTILVCVGLIIGMANRAVEYFSNDNEKKVEIAKKYVSEAILKMITDAELDYAEWSKAGSLKRSQVIMEIFAQYPILTKAVNQDEVIKWIDNEIDNSLKTLRDIIKVNSNDGGIQ